jgi:hypothetical protein
MEANATLQALLTPQKPTRLSQTSMDNPRLSHLPIHAGPKATVSTKTYVNMLATNLVAALHITGQGVTKASSLSERPTSDGSRMVNFGHEQEI